MYVLATPGFIPSATTLTLGGSEVDAVGRLVRDDGLQVLPGYFADGFSEGDRLDIAPAGHSAWRVSLIGGKCVYRSGHLSMVPCYRSDLMPPAYKLLASKSFPLREEIRVDDPSGEVIAVNENQVIELRPDPVEMASNVRTSFRPDFRRFFAHRT